MIFNMVGGGAGGAGGGAALVVSSPANVSVTVSKDDKSYTKNSGSLGSTTFKGLATGTWTVTIRGNGQTATKTIEITADYAITIAFFSATINITYPANSTCVVTNSSGQTVASDTNTTSSAKTWTATVNATGTYTATATDGSGKSKSQSVSITADGQSVSVELSYNFIIIDGTTCRSDFEASFHSASGKTGTWEPSIDCYLYVSPSDGYGVVQGKYDLTKYNALKLTLKSTSGVAYNEMKWIGVNSTSVSAIKPAANIAKTTIPTSATDTTYTVDISNVTGEQYIILAGTANSGSIRYEITKLWLE